MDELERRPTLAHTETQLVNGYRRARLPVPRVENCACGGQIVSADFDADIWANVAIHNRSTRHQQWRWWMRL